MQPDGQYDPETSKRRTQGIYTEPEISINIINMREYLKNMNFHMTQKI